MVLLKFDLKTKMQRMGPDSALTDIRPRHSYYTLVTISQHAEWNYQW